MFDAEADAMSINSRSSRLPSLIAPENMSMQEFYAMQAGQPVNIVLQPAAAISQPNRTIQRRNSSSSIMSDTERMYGWSGSKGGIGNEAAAPKIRVSSSGRLVLANHLLKSDSNAETASPGDTTTGANGTRPALRSHQSDTSTKSGKPMYRPAFAPSTELPPSSEDEEDLDRVIQHDLPSSGLKPRTSLKQKLGSLVARVGSSRNRTASPNRPPLPSPSGRVITQVDEKGDENDENKNPDAGAAQDYLSVKKIDATSAAVTPGTPNTPGLTGSTALKKSATTAGAPKRPDLTRSRSSAKGYAGGSALGNVGTVQFDEDDIIRSSDGGVYAGGFAGLARRLSRRATTGGNSGGPPRPTGARARLLAEERAKEAAIADRAAAEQMLLAMAEIPLYKAPRSAHVPNAKPLSSFAPRAPLETNTNPGGDLANAPRYSYYQRPLKDADGKRAHPGGSYMQRANTSNPAASGSSATKVRPSRHRSGSTPSMSSLSSTAPLLVSAASPGSTPAHRNVKDSKTQQQAADTPPVPPLPVLKADAPNKTIWEKFSSPEDSTKDLASSAAGQSVPPAAVSKNDSKA